MCLNKCYTPYHHLIRIFFGFKSHQLNNIGRFGLSSDVLKCYELNKFSFGDALNTAKNTAMQCINEKVNEGRTIADNAINDIQTAIQNITGGAQLMAQCSQYTVQFPSMAGLVAKVTCLGQVNEDKWHAIKSRKIVIFLLCQYRH